MALDLDGTVLNRDLQIHPTTISALRAALDRGRLATIVTGRMFASARVYAQRLGLGDMPLVTYNGGLIRTAESEKTYFHLPVDLAPAAGVARLTKELDYSLNLYVDDKLVVEEVNERVRLYTSIALVEAQAVGDLSAYLAGDEAHRPTKMLVVDDEARIETLRQAVVAAYPSELYTVTSYPYFLEMMNPAVSKSKALGALSKQLGVDRDEILAIGDSFNDLDMLEYAGLGVAMGTAPEPVKARADYVTAGTDEGGVAAAIERFVLEGRA